MLNFILWSPKPYIVDLGFTELRYYGLLFALGFIVSQQIMIRIFKKEGRKESEVETLTLYMVLATILGARLGHVLFYEPARYLSNPLDIFKVWEGGLASHGGAVGILIALYLFSRRYKDMNYLWILDRIVIVVAITGAFIRFGNFMNSEIIGKPTDSSVGIVFGRDIETKLQYANGAIEEVDLTKFTSTTQTEIKNPLNVEITFKAGNALKDVKAYVEQTLIPYMRKSSIAEHLYLKENPIVNFNEKNSQVTASILGSGITRHPAQLYESFSCLILFLLLFYLWNKNRSGLADGRLFGIFLIVCFGLRFLYEFIKENQVAFEDELQFNMGQWLSIPLVLAGIYFIYYSIKSEKRKM